MHTSTDFFKGHLEQIYATEQITQQICSFKDVLNYKIASQMGCFLHSEQKPSLAMTWCFPLQPIVRSDYEQTVFTLVVN